MPFQHRPIAPGLRVSRTSVACIRVGHNFANYMDSCCQFMSSDALVHLLNTLGSAVIQLAGCLIKHAVEIKVQQSYNAGAKD